MSDTRNGFHGSDSEVNARWELSLVMPTFDIDRWISDEFERQRRAEKSDEENKNRSSWQP